jgi:hypothetical protein
MPIPSVPWQFTGNHWIAIPCIHPADGSIHSLGVLHRASRAAVEFAGAEDFIEGNGPPLLRPVIRLAGRELSLGEAGLAWERALGWLPTFTSSAESLVIRGTVFAPYGRDADIAGAVYAIAVENRGDNKVQLELSLEGCLGHRQLRVRAPRSADDAHRVVRRGKDVLVLEGAALPGLVAVALASDGEVKLETTEGAAPTFAMRRSLELEPGGKGSIAFFIAVGPERDGAEATARVLQRRGWSQLLALTSDALRGLEQTVGHDGLDALINRNLLHAYFYGVGRALDDAHFYLVRSRAPWHGLGVTVRDWEALTWTLPAIQLADAPLARELLIRACELHGYAPGNGVHYFDGSLFEPGFSIEGVSSFAIGVDRYIRETGDDQIVEDPVIAETLYASSEDLAAHRDAQVALYFTEVMPSGAPAPLPFTLHGNAVAAMALDVFRRVLDEEAAREVQDPEAVRAALHRHFAQERGGRLTFAAAVDLAGNTVREDDWQASAFWLPLYEAVERQDSVYRRTVRTFKGEPFSLVQQCARLIGPEPGPVLQWLRRAPLDNGVGAEVVNADGRALANGGDAAVSGLIAWCVWYAVHALGAQP